MFVRTLSDIHNCCLSDVDECLVYPHLCQWQCVNQPGSYRCVCPEGYQLQGTRMCQGRHLQSELRVKYTHTLYLY